MDIAALSVMMANQHVKADAGVLIMNRTKSLMEQQGNQLIDMLQQSGTPAPHPDLGKQIDVSV
ncbi:YjfB family protein [Lentibacillus saliphilus]|uniref:YjfB family protein n=1 Tax=Lentibacillus saliphilus TaxID=2737028 RepID=UPI001C2FB442|nr:YjfB family protein [Lentibacillus saliphilus]